MYLYSESEEYGGTQFLLGTRDTKPRGGKNPYIEGPQ